MGLFTRKKSSFTSSGINLGPSSPLFLKPTKKELGQITMGSRLSKQPHGVKPRTKKSSLRRHYREASGIVNDFRDLNPTSVNEFSSGFGGYDSKSHLDRNLGL